MSNKLFKYKGRDINGNPIDGKLAATDVNDVIMHLKKENVTPINIEEIHKKSRIQKIFSFNLKIKRKVEDHHVMNFCRQLSLLNNTGIPLIEAIRKLSMSSTSKPLQDILESVANDIAAGMTLSDAFKKHPSAFSPIITNITRVGENTGNLSEVLTYLSKYIETTIRNSRRLKSAVRYPMFVTLSAIIAIAVMNFMVIPKFAMMFSRFNIDLPLPTKMIIWSSDFMINNKISILIAITIILIVINRLIKIPKFRYIWDRYKLSIPIFGEMQSKIIISQFAWTFSLILRSGIPIIRGLSLASVSTNNLFFQKRLMKMGKAIEHGENLSKAAIHSELFSPITIQMIEVGEESEKLDETLSEISNYYDSEIEYSLKRVNELIEPILLAIIGIIVTIMALGIYFPMWDIIQVAKI